MIRFSPPAGVLALLSLLASAANPCAAADAPAPDFGPGRRVLLDAHNCYPYQGRWADRIDRALAAGLPVAIEQDLVWREDPAGGGGRSIVSHGKPFTGEEPSLKEYFFEKIRPIAEKALADPDRANWPLITLNLDFKDDGIPHLEAIWAVLGEYESWLTTAPRNADPSIREPLTPGPVLVLAGGSERQEEVFHDRLKAGEKLRVFGQARSRRTPPGSNPEDELTEPAGNFRRWWNNAWRAAEPGGQRKAGDWTAEEDARLRAMTARAHELGYWVRFYTLNGHAEPFKNGWSPDYNFGSIEAAKLRWRACRAAGVDFIACDQYEELAAFLKEPAAR